MTLAKWRGTIVDTSGNVMPGSSVEVRDEDNGALVQLYSDRNGNIAIGNPLLSDANGIAEFHVEGGAYKITATSGTLERVWRYVGIGTAQEWDIEKLGAYLETGIAPFKTHAAMLLFIPTASQHVGALVLADPDGTKNGYYTWTGTAWSWARALPDALTRLFVAGGTPDAIVATLPPGVNRNTPIVFFIDVETPNTGNVTIAIAGDAPVPVRNAGGHEFQPGEWIGRLLLSREPDNSLQAINSDADLIVIMTQLLADTVSAKLAAGTAKTAAETARDSAHLWSSAAKNVPVNDGVNSGFSAYHWALMAEQNSGGGSGNVTSVNGDTGPDVVLVKADIGLGNVDNTSDLDKPISTATQAALDTKLAESEFAQKIAIMQHGTVGTYAMLGAWSVALSAVAVGGTIAGSSLRYTCFRATKGASLNDEIASGVIGTPPGTWRCMGYFAAVTTISGTGSLFLRIS